MLLLLARFSAAGQTNHVVDLARALSRFGHEVTLVNTQAGQPGQIHGRHYSRVLRTGGVTVVESDLLAGLPEGFRAVPDLVHAHSTLDFARAEQLASRLGVPYVLTVHGLGASRQPYARSLARAGAVIAVGERVARDALTAAPNVTVIENGVDTEQFHPPEGCRGNGLFTVTFAGRIDPPRRHGFRQLTRGVVQLSVLYPVRLVVLAPSLPGAGRDLEAKLERIVDFRGWLPDPAPALREADVVVGTGRVVREGLASGRPSLILGRSYGGVVVPWVLDPSHGHDFSGRPDGWEESSCDAARIASDLAGLAGGPALARRLGEEGRAYALAHLSLERMAELTVGVYERVLTRSHRVPVAGGPAGAAGSRPGPPLKGVRGPFPSPRTPHWRR